MAGVVRVGRFVSPYSYEWYIRAELLALRGDYAGAVAAYRQALAGPEEDPLVLAHMADALDHLGQRQAADQVLERAAKIDPDSEAAWLTRAEIAERRGELQPAIEAFQHAELAAPQSEAAPLGLAALLRAKGAEERAMEVLENFARRSTAGSAAAARARLSLAIAKGDSAAASSAIAELLKTAPARVEEVRSVARLALESRDIELALRMLDRLPRSPEDNQLRLRALLAAGRDTAVEQLLAAEPVESLGGPMEAARAYLEIGRPEQAQELAEAMLAKGIKSDALLIAAEAKLRQGRYAEAAERFARVASGTDEFCSARLGLARALYASGLPELAAETLAHTLRYEPSLSEDAKRQIAEALSKLRSQIGFPAER